MRETDVEQDGVTCFGVEMKSLTTLLVWRPMGAWLDPQTPAITVGLEIDGHLVDLAVLSGKVVAREVRLGLATVLMPAAEAILRYVTMAREEDVFGTECCPERCQYIGMTVEPVNLGNVACRVRHVAPEMAAHMLLVAEEVVTGST